MKVNEQIEQVIHKLKFWGFKLTKVQEANLRLALLEIAMLSSGQTLTDLKRKNFDDGN